MIRDKRIIVDTIKDHLIPQVYSKDTPKEIIAGIILGAKFIPWAIFRGFSRKTY